MKFGKIQYLNLVPFDMFIKSYPLPTQFKQALFFRRSYPSKLNQSFLFRRIDAGFISSIAGYKSALLHKATMSGIISKGAVWSVIVLPNDDKIDYQSQTSNALCKILGLKGEVLIGDRALKARYNGAKYIDMGEEWFKKHRLPFVFGRLCFNKYANFYTHISARFNAKKTKIPFYIVSSHAKTTGIDMAYIKEYLTHIYYKISHKEHSGLKRFYRALRLEQIPFPHRIYPQDITKNITKKRDKSKK